VAYLPARSSASSSMRTSASRLYETAPRPIEHDADVGRRILLKHEEPAVGRNVVVLTTAHFGVREIRTAKELAGNPNV
jgi:hypothetical protein